MPKPVARLGDSDSRGSRQVKGSTTVFANKLPVCTAGDPDTGAGSDPVGRAISASNVFVEGRPMYAAGDPDTAGRTQVQGSLNVFVN